MKKIFIVLAAVLLAVGCTKQQPVQNPDNSGQNQNATTTPPVTPPTTNSYTSPDQYGFYIQYLSDLGFSTSYQQVQALAYIPVCDSHMLACAYLPHDSYPGTNFEAAGVSINVDPTLTTQTKCYNFAVSTNEAQTAVPDVTINTVAFKSATGGGGAAGHFDKVQVYRVFHNNMCYEISQTMVETNVNNYDPGTVKQFDEADVWQRLQSVIDTFKFTK